MACGFLATMGAPATTLGDAKSAEAEPAAPDEVAIVERNPNLDGLSWQLLVSSYYMFNAHRVAGPYNALAYPYADSPGFGLTFAGGDVAYRGKQWGVTLALRWGQNVDRLTEIAPLSLGYATWIPHEMITLDFGYFDAFIGIEHEDEWRNPNFSRGLLYFRIQPFRHLGLRAVLEPHEQVDITVIVARGSIFGTSFPDAVSDTVVAPTVGAQIAYAPHETVELQLGAVAGPNGSNRNRNWQSTIDFIAEWSPGAGMLFVDGDYQFSSDGPLTGTPVSRQWGVSLGGRYAITDHWTVGGRGEYMGASTGSDSSPQFSVTGTVRYLPVEYLILSLEPRAEFAGKDIYFARPYSTDPATGITSPSLNQAWFFGFWLGVTARLGN